MKYIVCRSSNSAKKPCDNAQPVQIHEYWSFSKFSYEHNEHFNELYRDVVLDEDGDVERCTKIEPQKTWLCEIDNLHEFATEYGQIILSPPNNEEGYWEIEIYDSYRE